jgi:hypothetical protein
VWIGVLEAALTAGIVAALAWQPERQRRVALCCLIATVLLLALWPLSSSLPDGYEAAAIASGQEQLLD